MDIKEITRRITKAADLGREIDTALEDVQNGGLVREMITEDVVTSVLVELLASLEAGESLEDAIETIQQNC